MLSSMRLTKHSNCLPVYEVVLNTLSVSALSRSLMATISDLPPEMRSLIAQQLDLMNSRGSMYSLCLASKDFYHSASPILYRRLDLMSYQAPARLNPYECTIRFLDTIGRRRDLAQHVRIVRLQMAALESVDSSSSSPPPKVLDPCERGAASETWSHEHRVRALSPHDLLEELVTKLPGLEELKLPARGLDRVPQNEEPRHLVINSVIRLGVPILNHLKCIDLGETYGYSLVELATLLQIPSLQTFKASNCINDQNDNVDGRCLADLLPRDSCVVFDLEFSCCGFDSVSLTTLLDACKELRRFCYHGIDSLASYDLSAHFTPGELDVCLSKHKDSLVELGLDLTHVSETDLWSEFSLIAYPRLHSLWLACDGYSRRQSYPGELRCLHLTQCDDFTPHVLAELFEDGKPKLRRLQTIHCRSHPGAGGCDEQQLREWCDDDLQTNGIRLLVDSHDRHDRDSFDPPFEF